MPGSATKPRCTPACRFRSTISPRTSAHCATWRFRSSSRHTTASAGMPWFSNTAQKRDFRRNLWVVDPAAYYGHLLAVNYRSTAARYNQLNDDVRNDVVRIPRSSTWHGASSRPTANGRRPWTILTDISPPERFNALARVAENNLTIAWVQTSLSQRCAGYRFALIALRFPSPKAWRRTSTSRSCCCSKISRPTN